ncbi:DotD/TraH family lipoprotein [Marinobacter sp. MBR-105]|jgi:defect-in-organelle-trafficking protein DotD
MNFPKLAKAGSVVLVTGVLMAGCSTKTARVEVDPAVVKLSEAANEISHAYRILSYSESARLSDNGAANPLKYELSNFPKAWHAQYALEDDYYGELEPFIRGLAKLVGTGEPQVVGPRPILPIAISINRASKPLAEFLVDASYQAGARAKVVLDSKNKLKIIYPN